jgi:hypothetical protein
MRLNKETVRTKCRYRLKNSLANLTNLTYLPCRVRYRLVKQKKSPRMKVMARCC